MPRGDEDNPAVLPPPPQLAGMMLDDSAPIAVPAPEASPPAVEANSAIFAGMFAEEFSAPPSFKLVRSWAVNYTDQLLQWSAVRGKNPNVEGLATPPVCDECGCAIVAAIYEVLNEKTQQTLHTCKSCAQASLVTGEGRTEGLPVWLNSQMKTRLAKSMAKYAQYVRDGLVHADGFTPDESSHEVQVVIAALLDYANNDTGQRKDRLDMREQIARYAQSVHDDPLIAFKERELNEIRRLLKELDKAKDDISLKTFEIGAELTDLQLTISNYKLTYDAFNNTNLTFTGTDSDGHRYWLKMNASSKDALLIRDNADETRGYQEGLQTSYKLQNPLKVQISRCVVKGQGDDKGITFLKRPTGKGSRNILTLN